MKSDQWFYRLFRDRPWLLFRLMGASEAQATDFRFDAPELKEISVRLDGVFCPARADGLHYFLEVQLYKDEEFYRKWIVKILLYSLQYRMQGDWRGLVVFGNRQQERGQNQGIEEWIASGRIQRVYLEELPDFPETSLDVAVLKLAVTKEVDVLEKARDLVTVVRNNQANVIEPAKLLGMIEAFVVSNFPDITRQEIQIMLQLHDIRESRIYKEGLQDGKIEEKTAMIARLHSKGLSIEQICDFLGVDAEIVRKALASPPLDA
jgi:predicted transposase/invertase (TIGR01784 family)